MLITITSLVLFIVFLMIGAPIAFCLALPMLFFLVLEPSIPFSMVPHRMTGPLFTYVLIALPAFLLAGRMMNSSGVTNRLLNLAIALVGRFPGGLAYSNVIASSFFASMSGTSVGDAGGLGQVEIKMMKDAKYNIDFAAGITAASSALGPILPPSVVMVIFGATAGISIGRLFLAGIIPGAFLILALLITIWIRASFTKEGKSWPKEKTDLMGVLIAIKRGFLPMMAPLIIVGGIAGGIVTPTEAAIAAIDYAILLGIIYKEISFKKLWHTLEETVVMTGVFMFIMAVAGFFTWVLTREGLPQLIASLFQPLIVSNNPIIGLLVIAAFLLVIGLFLDATPAILLVTPILLPVTNSLGIDPIQFGIVLILSLVTGIITPPYGICLFVMSDVAGIPVSNIARESIKYLPAMFIVLLLLCLFPEISTFIPDLLMTD